MLYPQFTSFSRNTWKLYYFQRTNGRAPVEEYLDTVNDQRQLAAIYTTIERLGQFGTTLPAPLSKHLERKLWELRTRFGNRIFYCLGGDHDIILLDGHTKKRERLEARVLDRVRNLYQEYLITRQRKPF
jgi:hypothetical protein